jgi:3'(2'), 5'-bisphosphate nucleotidase
MKDYLKTAIEASIAAGREIMKIYEEKDLQVELKEDDSPLTIADRKANDIINEFLIPTGVPVISEENTQLSFEERKNWKRCWIVDPLDGTKEFVKRNGEFTVNIALVLEGNPVLGVIYAPALKSLYFADVSESKAFQVVLESEDVHVDEIFQNARQIFPEQAGSQIKVVGSRSHMNQATLDFIEKLKAGGKEVDVISRGSSLKFCLLAEGAAHVYPRFGPTMEWDTAAGQAICEAVGFACKWADSGERITYNRENLKNDHFSVVYER